jgi:DNA-binding GntR family transcriptional regulator
MVLAKRFGSSTTPVQEALQLLRDGRFEVFVRCAP